MPVTDRRASPPRGSADSGRRSVVPPAAGRSPWLAAAWTGAGAALTCLIVSIVAVAICWLPVSGNSGSAGSVVRAGTLTFLAALHGGITVDGMASAFVPLGMTLLVAAAAWRAGCGLADATDDVDEDRAGLLVQAAAVQAGAFAAVCGVAAGLSPLGTSEAPVAGATVAGFLLFALFGGAALVRWSALGVLLAAQLPSWVARAARAAAAAALTYLAAGALLVAVAVVVNHDRVELLSQQVGGGWSGLPILLLGLLAAPNAAAAGASYLAGPGFAVGSGSHVSAVTTAHGLLPAFPLLGALPTGHGAPWPVWLLISLVALVAGGAVARITGRAPTPRERFRDAGAAAAGVTVLGIVVAWQGGGAVGSGRLNALGASPWQFGLALGLSVGVVSCTMLASARLVVHLRARAEDPDASGLLRTSIAVLAEGVASYRTGADADDPGETDQVADADTTVDTTPVTGTGPPAPGDGRRGDKLAG